MTTDAFRMIVELIRDPAKGQQLDTMQWEEAIHVLREANLLGTLCYLSDRDNLLRGYPAYAQHHLTAMRTYSDRQATQVRYECAEIDKILKAINITPVFLKGAGYTIRGSCNALGRIYTDIDVLVRKEEIEPAQQALKKNMWHSKTLRRYDERYYRRWAHEVPPMKHLFRRTVVDLHHNIVPPISGRAPNPAILRGVFAATSEGLCVLSPPAATLHSLVHLFTNEDFTNAFRDLIDLYLLVNEFGTDAFWDELMRLADVTGFSLELYYGLRLLEENLDSDVPVGVITPLRATYGTRHREWVINRIFCHAVRPHHPSVCGRRQDWAIQAAYLRGHWIKMPLPVLVAHLSVKAWFSLVDRLFGKYQFEKKAPQLPHN